VSPTMVLIGRGADKPPRVPSAAGPKAPGQIRQSHRRSVVRCELRSGSLRNTAGDETAAEPPGAPALTASKADIRADEPGEEAGDPDRNLHPLEDPPHSSSPDLRKSKFIPFAPTMSRRLIMYPRVMEIASSRGMPESTSRL